MRIGIMLILLTLFTPLVVPGWAAEPMTFRLAGSDVRFCPERCAFIQATGDITSDTPKAFEIFIRANPYNSGVVRLNSGGGSLQAGLELGRLFRTHQFWTEVGSDEPDPSGEETFEGVPFTQRAKGHCASACAYAFLGGVRRVLLTGDRLGVHRFYRSSALERPSVTLFTGQDLDDEQRTVARLALYMVNMGVDATLLTVADEAGPNEMRWLTLDEAAAFRVAYNPDAWRPWRIETFRQGVVAVSEKADGTARMVASCTKARGSQLVLTNLRPGTLEWLKGCQDYTHIVLGEDVPRSATEIIALPNGASMRFRLPTNRPKFGSPGLFEHTTRYPTACSTLGWGGNAANMEAAVRIALRNCFDG
jgi:hypothetical protein